MRRDATIAGVLPADVFRALAFAIWRRLALEDRASAYRRRVRVRGRGTRPGCDLALAYFRRFRLTSPMFNREARA